MVCGQHSGYYILMKYIDSSGTASSVHVSSVVTGTSGAGQGNKYGTADVTILVDLGNAVSGAP